MLFSFLLIAGCEKEEFIPTKDTFVSAPLSYDTDQKNSSLVMLSDNLRAQLTSYVLADAKGEDQSKSSSLDSLLQDILAQPAKVVLEDSTGAQNYTSHVPTEDPLHILNLVYRVENDSLSHGYLYLFKMAPEFALQFNNFSAPIKDFVGEVSLYPIGKLDQLIYKHKNKTIEGDCFTLLFNGQNSGTSGGGGSDATIAGTVLGNINGGISGGINWGTSSGYVGIIGGPGHTPSSSNTGNNNGSTGGNGNTSTTGNNGDGDVKPCGVASGTVVQTFYNDDESIHSVIIEYINCIDGSTRRTLQEYLVTITVVESENKTFESEDCIKLLSSVGVVPRPLSIPYTSAKVFEQISAAIAETCFDENAVMDMIDPDAFEACYDSGAEPVFCIIDQIISYLNGLDYPSSNIPGTPITTSVTFDGLTHDQLAPFLHAAIAANGNEHVLAGIYAARRDLSKDFINSNIPLQILLLSNLSMQASSAEAFFTLVGKYYALVELSTTELKNSHFTWMVNNMNDVSLLLNFKEEHPNLDIDLYLDIMEKHHNEVVLSQMLEDYVDWSVLEDGDTPILEFDNYVTLGTPDVHLGSFNSFQKVAALPPRPGYDETDMCNDCWDHAIQYVNGSTLSEADHWSNMRVLFEASTIGSLDNVGELFINRFKNSTGGELHAADLTRSVMVHQSTENTLRYFGDWFSSKLTVSNGGLDFPTVNLNPSFRPSFSESKIAGLTILVNDTYKTDFRIVDIQVNQQSRTWSAVIGVEIHDHFGVDFVDILDTQHISSGFSSWFRLQHQYDYKPFTSVMKFTIPIEGTY